ncbi:MAG: aminopeptidase [Opitutaceae bacterium]|nr:aminopeptidase [Opitutaceae bacterium]
MIADFEPRLHAFAEVIVRVGLNLQPGQRLLIAEPYELQGVARSAEVIVESIIKAAATDAEVIWGDGPRLREFAEKADWRGFNQLAAGNAKRLAEGIRRGDALLFLQGSQPRLLDGLPPERVAALRRIGWENFGPVAQQLVQGATNWSVAPAPSPAWAHAAYPDLPSDQRLAALWQDVFTATRVNEPSPVAAWELHLRLLRRECASLNQQRLRTLRYKGEGTDLTVALPPGHVWCTAQLATKSGLPFVANLPTEEIFTAPHRDSAEGHVRVSRPISYSGALIEGIKLEFKRGAVVAASARTGADLLERLLDTDEGSVRLGEVAIVPEQTPLGRANRLFYHPLLDENATSHIALGEAYGFCQRPPDPAALNRSLVHVDLPFEASIIRSDTEPA